MIDAISAIADAVTAAGCNQIFYESDKLGNIKMDESLQSNIIGLIIEPNEITKNVKANAIEDHYLIYIEILQQVRLETEALSNASIYESLSLVCDKVIRKLIEYSQVGPDNMFSKIIPMTITKVLESKYDANCIGWSMPLNVTYLKNENFCPITSP